MNGASYRLLLWLIKRTYSELCQCLTGNLVLGVKFGIIVFGDTLRA